MDIYQMRAKVLKALAHPARLELVDMLMSEGEICVCELTERVGISQPMCSRHLAILKDAGIVTSRKEGLMVFYRIRTPCISRFFDCIDAVLQADLAARENQLQCGRCDGEAREHDAN